MDRAQVGNATSAFIWGASSDGSFYTQAPRTYRLTLAADL